MASAQRGVERSYVVLFLRFDSHARLKTRVPRKKRHLQPVCQLSILASFVDGQASRHTQVRRLFLAP